jgi:uncharacterized phage protein (TIGR02218 family)
MRDCGTALAALLASGQVELAQADLYDVTTQSGTVFHWTNFDVEIPYGGNTYTNYGPFLQRTKVQTVNTMSIPTLEITMLATDASFNGGADLMSQMHNGLFDGATLILNRLFMLYPVTLPIDTSLGTILYFGGVLSTIEIEGVKTTLKVKGANNKLDQYAPRNLFQIGCLHNFCDSGCTLNAASFTYDCTVPSSPAASKIYVPWTTAPAVSPITLFQLGALTMTSGAASGQSRDIAFADSTGVYLEYPLYDVPQPGDTFTVFEGCDKTNATCTSRGNEQNWRGFPFVPPAFQNF